MRALLPRFQDWYRAIGRTRRKYKSRHGRALSLYRPRRFSEKMQWRKLFDLDPIYVTLCDKLAARDYIAARIGSDLLVPLLWAGADPDAFPFDILDPPYVIKSSHASGHIMIVGSRADLDIAQTRDNVRGWLGQCHGTLVDELGYIPVPRRIMVERQVLGPDGERPLERRLFVFNGRVRVIQTTAIVDGKARNGGFHTPDWQPQNWRLESPLLERSFPRPYCLDVLIEAAEGVARDLEHARVDFYDCGTRVYIGEITSYSWSGLTPFRTDEADLALGSYWKLRAPARRAVMTMLLRDRRITASAPAETR